MPSRVRNGSVAAYGKRVDRDTQSVHSESIANGVSGAWGSNPSFTAASVVLPAANEGSFRPDSKKTVDESNASNEQISNQPSSNDNVVVSEPPCCQAPQNHPPPLPKPESQLSCDSAGPTGVLNPLALPLLGDIEGMPRVYTIPTTRITDNPLSQGTENPTSASVSRTPSMPSRVDEFERLLMEAAWEDDDDDELESR